MAEGAAGVPSRMSEDHVQWPANHAIWRALLSSRSEQATGCSQNSIAIMAAMLRRRITPNRLASPLLEHKNQRKVHRKLQNTNTYTVQVDPNIKPPAPGVRIIVY